MPKRTRTNNLHDDVDAIHEHLFSSDESEIDDDDIDDPIYRDASSSSSSSSSSEDEGPDPARQYDMIQSLSNPDDGPSQIPSWLEPPRRRARMEPSMASPAVTRTRGRGQGRGRGRGQGRGRGRGQGRGRGSGPGSSSGTVRGRGRSRGRSQARGRGRGRGRGCATDVTSEPGDPISNEEWEWVDGSGFIPVEIPFLDEDEAGCTHPDLSDSSSESSFFYNFITNELVDQIVECTNNYIYFRRAGKIQTPRGRIWDPNPITRGEMYVFLGLSISMGIVKKKKLHNYWSTDPIINTPLYSNTMNRDRYQFILSNLHFFDMLKTENREPQIERDRMRRIRLVFDHLRSAFSNAHNPSKNLVIDESLVLWRGNIGFRQYIPSKRHRFGLKLFVLCDCKSGFIQDIILYTGKDTQIGGTETFGVSGAVVLELLEQYLGRGHTLYIDNWYTSPLLAEELLKYDTGVCGTVKRSRKKMPELQEKMQAKEVYFFQEKNILLTHWQDKREVNVLSTVHNPVVMKTKSRAYNTWVWKPECVLYYNVNMRQVDQSDGMIASVECARTTSKWYKKLFFHMLDIVVLNSHILHRDVTKSSYTL